MKTTLSLAGLLIGLSAATSHAANTVLFTEDFEGYGIADGAFADNLDGLTAGGWTLGKNTGNLLNPATTAPTNAWLDPVPDALGTTFAALRQGGWFWQDLGLNIEADTVYEFSLTHFKRDDTAGDAIQMRFLANSVTGGFLSETFAAVTTNDTFVTRSIVWDSGLNASQNGNSLGILVFDSNGGPSSNQAGIDNLIVTSVPEPSAALLGGLGLLALLRRRRH